MIAHVSKHQNKLYVHQNSCSEDSKVMMTCVHKIFFVITSFHWLPKPGFEPWIRATLVDIVPFIF